MFLNAKSNTLKLSDVISQFAKLTAQSDAEADLIRAQYNDSGVVEFNADVVEKILTSPKPCETERKLFLESLSPEQVFALITLYYIGSTEESGCDALDYYKSLRSGSFNFSNKESSIDALMEKNRCAHYIINGTKYIRGNADALPTLIATHCLKG